MLFVLLTLAYTLIVRVVLAVEGVRIRVSIISINRLTNCCACTEIESTPSRSLFLELHPRNPPDIIFCDLLLCQS